MTLEELQTKAKRLADSMDYKEMQNGTKRVICTADINSPEWDEVMGILRAVDENTTLGEDSRYRFTMEALGDIVDNTSSTLEELEETLTDSIEADVYTSDLTEWLNESNYHVEYLSEALTEYGTPESGFQLLGLAQHIAKEQAYRTVLSKLLE